MSVHNVTDLERRIAAAWLKLTLHFTQTLTRTQDAHGVDPESLSVSVSVSLCLPQGVLKVGQWNCVVFPTFT